MKFIRFLTDASAAPATGILHADGTAEPIAGDLFGAWSPAGRRLRVAKLLAPLQPPVILAIGLNFREHARETNQPVPEFPVLFMKSPWALQNPGGPILIPTHLASTRVDYEAELVVVLGKTCKNATRENALDHVFGYTCGNDVTARDWQKSFGGNQWCRGKSFDTFAPLGPCLVTKDEIPDPQALELKATVNGEVRQRSNTSDQIFSVADLIVFLSGSTTLPAGTAIFTGTPPGAGFARTPPAFLAPGDTVTIAIAGIGELTNPVALEPSAIPPAIPPER
jgi:2-keto-4-pentenoate hydratase/2-oxohepta-3-ene-1,7-dioic acid hydratase in catechol pathway